MKTRNKITYRCFPDDLFRSLTLVSLTTYKTDSIVFWPTPWRELTMPYPKPALKKIIPGNYYHLIIIGLFRARTIPITTFMMSLVLYFHFDDLSTTHDSHLKLSGYSLIRRRSLTSLPMTTFIKSFKLYLPHWGLNVLPDSYLNSGVYSLIKRRSLTSFGMTYI